MHDFLLAKEIVDKVLEIAKEKEIDKIKKVSLEVGSVTLSHDGMPEHTEDISIENLEFGLESIAKGTVLENASLDIKKIEGDNWRITNIEV